MRLSASGVSTGSLGIRVHSSADLHENTHVEEISLDFKGHLGNKWDYQGDQIHRNQKRTKSRTLETTTMMKQLEEPIKKKYISEKDNQNKVSKSLGEICQDLLNAAEESS